MVTVDTHCHALPYWFEPVEILLDQMARNDVDKAVLIQINGMYDNSYLIECMRRFPGRFSVVALVDTDNLDAPQRLAEWVEQGVEGIRLRSAARSPGSDHLAIWHKAAELGIVVSCPGSADDFASPEFENLVKELPGLKIVIEHLGGGGRDTPPYDTYRRVLALAQYPNTFMKVPGLGEICPRPSPFIHESRLVGCAVCVVADRFGARAGEWQGEEGLAMLTRIAPYLGDAPVVFAGASQVELLSRAADETLIRRERLIGSSPEALASAITAIVAMEAGCSPREVMLTVLGTPPAGFVVPWSDASIGGYALQRVLSQVQLVRIEALAARLWPPGPYALGAAAARVTDAILSNSRRSFSVLTQLEGEFGVRHRAGTLPARLAAPGIVQTRVPELSTREHVQLQTALGG